MKQLTLVSCFFLPLTFLSVRTHLAFSTKLYLLLTAS